MMTKSEFLSALQQRISMLEQAEQKDILEEYAQHLQIRMEEGLTEEEAIRDFGPIEELTAEIMEAYHIDPAFGSPKAPKSVRTDPLPGLWQRFKEKCRSFFEKCSGLFRRKEKTAEKKPLRQQGRFFPALRSGCTRLWQWCRHLCLAALRLCWNIFLLGCAVLLTLPLLAGFVLLGMCIIFWAQGLPLAGVVLMLLGGICICAALLGLGRNLIWRRNIPDCAGKEEQI